MRHGKTNRDGGWMDVDQETVETERVFVFVFNSPHMQLCHQEPRVECVREGALCNKHEALNTHEIWKHLSFAIRFPILNQFSFVSRRLRFLIGCCSVGAAPHSLSKKSSMLILSTQHVYMRKAAILIFCEDTRSS